jgi:hypothetical protein
MIALDPDHEACAAVSKRSKTVVCEPSRTERSSMSNWQVVHDSIRAGDIASAITALEGFIAKQDANKFSCLLTDSFSNSPGAVLDMLNSFIEANDERFDVKAVYLEMNGFGINYDEWFFSPFAYDSYSSKSDVTDWLGDWQSPEEIQVTLIGMESSQRAFAWYHEEEIWRSQRDFKPIYDASELLIVAKFMAFVESAIKSGKLVKPIPLLATAHDFYKSVARFDP